MIDFCPDDEYAVVLIRSKPDGCISHQTYSKITIIDPSKTIDIQYLLFGYAWVCNKERLCEYLLKHEPEMVICRFPLSKYKKGFIGKKDDIIYSIEIAQ